MITADEARQLFAEALYTLAEVEHQIRSDAIRSNFSAFRGQRFTEEIVDELHARGFVVHGVGTNDVVVRWEK